MGKVSLLAIIATVAGGGAAMAAETVASNCPKAFEGFHIGGNIGHGIGKGEQRNHSFFDIHSPISEQVIKNDLGYNGIDGGVGVGYTHRFCNWALGIAFDANWASTEGRQENNRIVRTPFIIGYSSRETKVNLRNSLQLYARAGYVIGQMVMPFVGLGWDNSEWRHKVTDKVTELIFVPYQSSAYNYQKSQARRYNALLWKAGMDFLMTKHVVIGIEYTGTLAGRKSLIAPIPLSGGEIRETVHSSFKPQYNKFALTAKLIY